MCMSGIFWVEFVCGYMLGEVQVCTCAYRYVFMCMHVCIEARCWCQVSFSSTLPFLAQNLSLTLELFNSSRLAGHELQGSAWNIGTLLILYITLHNSIHHRFTEVFYVDNHIKRISWSWKDSSGGKIYTVLTWGPEFSPQYLHKLSVLTCTVIPVLGRQR